MPRPRGRYRPPYKPADPQKQAFGFWKILWFALGVPAAVYGYYEGGSKLLPRIELLDGGKLAKSQVFSTQFIVNNPSFWNLRNIVVTYNLAGGEDHRNNIILNSAMRGTDKSRIEVLRRGKQSVLPEFSPVAGASYQRVEFAVSVTYESRFKKHEYVFRFISKLNDQGEAVLFPREK